MLPAFVESVANEVASDPDTREIWLIGSRAAASAHPASDWDLLVFSDREPSIRERRVEGVDVLHLGPSGFFLLEGQPAFQIIDFKTFRWKQTSPSTATYTGLRLRPVTPGVVLDGSEPAVEVRQCIGKLVWRRDSERLPNREF